MSAKFNGGLVKLQHQIWKNKLLTFLNGGELQIAVSHRDCAIGKWLYTEGGFDKNKYLPEMEAFEQQHAQYHDAIIKVIALQNAGNSTDAWKAYESLKVMSDQLMSIIDALSANVETNFAVTTSSRTKVA
jgi:hypothetical protein